MCCECLGKEAGYRWGTQVIIYSNVCLEYASLQSLLPCPKKIMAHLPTARWSGSYHPQCTKNSLDDTIHHGKIDTTKMVNDDNENTSLQTIAFYVAIL